MASSPHSMRRVRAQEPARGRLASRSAPGGEITGFYFDATNANHGFLRDTNGLITTFDVPGGGTGPGQGTYGGGFTPNGTIMGDYFDADNVSHGFLMNKDGAFTTFDAPDAGNVPGSDQGTYPFGINTNGAITGWYVDEANVNHGFVRDRHGDSLSSTFRARARAPARVRRLQHCSERRGDWILLRPEQRGSRLRARSSMGARWAYPNLPDSNSWPTDACYVSAIVFLNHRQQEIEAGTEPDGGVKPAILMGGPVQTAHEERIPVSIRLWCEAL